MLFDSLLMLYQEGRDQKSILVLNGRAECNPLAPGMWYTWNGFKKAQPLLLLLRARWGKRIYNNKIIMKIFFLWKGSCCYLNSSPFSHHHHSRHLKLRHTQAKHKGGLSKKGEPFFNSSIINPPTEHPDVWLPVSIKMSCLFSPFILARGDKNVS